MLAPEIVQEIRRLLSEGVLSQRRIARLMKVSRGTVGAIASGKRPDYTKRRSDDEDRQPTGPPRRCPECGGMVLMPCQACETRRMMVRQPSPLRRWNPLLDKPLGLDLRGKHQTRYEEVRMRRVLADASETSSKGMSPEKDEVAREHEPRGINPADLRDAFEDDVPEYVEESLDGVAVDGAGCRQAVEVMS